MANSREIKISVAAIEPWLFRVSANPKESFGHFLGRFRRANHLKSSHLSAMLGLQYHSVSYWEAPSRRRRPSVKELEALSLLTGVSAAQLHSMSLPEGTPLHMRTRLCALCYAEEPFHKLTWQHANLSNCDRHQRQLLCACPQCGCDFQLPSYWVIGQCEQCHLPFTEMSSAQRSAE